MRKSHSRYWHVIRDAKFTFVQVQFKRRRQHRDTAERLAVDYLIILRLRRAIGTLTETLLQVVTNTYRHFPDQRPISRSATDAEERRVRERVFCRAQRPRLLHLILMLVDIDVRHPSCFKSLCTSPSVVHAVWLLISLLLLPVTLHIVSRGPSRLSIALVTNFAAAGSKKCYYNRRYTFWLQKSRAESRSTSIHYNHVKSKKIFFLFILQFELL